MAVRTAQQECLTAEPGQSLAATGAVRNRPRHRARCSKPSTAEEPLCSSSILALHAPTLMNEATALVMTRKVSPLPLTAAKGATTASTRSCRACSRICRFTAYSKQDDAGSTAAPHKFFIS